jgi:hypothetical protein
MTRLWIISFVGAVAAAPLLAACGTLDCAEGTHEENGACVPSDDHENNAQCGPMTHLEGNACVPDEIVVCDPATTIESVDPVTGIVTCVGQGGGCDFPISCLDDAAGNKNKVCGRLVDMITGANIVASGEPVGIACGQDGAGTDGPCLLGLQFYDALVFASGDPTPLVVESIVIDDCGRFVGQNITPATSGYTAIGVDDATATDTYRTSGVAMITATQGGTLINPAKVRMLTVAADADWSADINFTGATIADRGAMAVRFLDAPGGTPVDGVTVTLSSATDPAHDYYFSDVDPTMQTSLDPAQTTTGVNGLAIVTDIGPSPLTTSGTGGGCTWTEALSAAIPTVFFYTERYCQ